MSGPPIVLLPLGADDDALDACLAALDAGSPAGTQVWLADDACAGPRGLAIVERWLASTPLRADYSRRQRGIGEVAHLDEALAACGDADVAVLAPDTVPAAGWLAQLTACFERDASIATATPWCNAGESAAWPRIGEISPIPDDLPRLGAACRSLPPLYPELPAAVGHAVLLRGSARKRAGGLDASSYASWYAALIDLSLRLSGLGWRNVLCERAFVARGGEGGPAEGDMPALAARWPDWHARLAGFLMRDPLHASRQALQAAYDTLEHPPAQHELFEKETAAEGRSPTPLSRETGERGTACSAGGGVRAAAHRVHDEVSADAAPADDDVIANPDIAGSDAEAIPHDKHAQQGGIEAPGDRARPDPPHDPGAQPPPAASGRAPDSAATGLTSPPLAYDAGADDDPPRADHGRRDA